MLGTPPLRSSRTTPGVKVADCSVASKTWRWWDNESEMMSGVSVKAENGVCRLITGARWDSGCPVET